MNPSLLKHWSRGYGEAREKFLSACAHAGAAMQRYENPNRSPDGESLVTDVAWFGAPDAERVLMIVSGTHGAEALGGAACQVSAVAEGDFEKLPAGVAVVLVHFINPYGAAWLQQETEEGVNLNRNYVDHSGSYPEAPLYAQIHDALLCPEYQGERHDAAERSIAEFRARNGLEKYQQALFGGQYHWPDGLNFGGNHPVWANRTLTEILTSRARHARHVAVLDIHSGLGPYGNAAIIQFCDKTSPAFLRATRWLGPSVFAVPGSTEQGGVNGTTSVGCVRALPRATVTPITIELGTLDIETEFRVVRQDLWLRNFGDRYSKIGRQIKNELVGYFYPDETAWRELVWGQSQQIIQKVLAGVCAEV